MRIVLVSDALALTKNGYAFLRFYSPNQTAVQLLLALRRSDPDEYSSALPVLFTYLVMVSLTSIS